VSGREVWVTSQASNRLLRVDSNGEPVGKPLRVGPQPFALAAGRTAWVTGLRDTVRADYQ
jgi:predicted RNA-binding protein YlxR (DUF448 family)